MQQQWIAVATIRDFVKNGGGAIRYGDKQIAVFNFNYEDWYAVDNRCPHWGQQLLSRGLIGNQCDVRKVACPLHKNAFDLETGAHLGGNEEWTLQTYEVKVEDGQVFLLLEPILEPAIG